ncbi:MAG TPA: DUF1467 family protein [Aliiroseovarius sp.]|nr:DUF1467 family protein [Aliiroseovarius sp.]
MSITSAIVLFAVTWFLTMFVVLPIRLRTQGDEDDIVEGTHAGAPADFRLGRTMLIVTIITVVLWGLEFAVITSGMISVRDFDWFGRMSPR